MKTITRDEALQISLEILEQAELERIEAAEEEAREEQTDAMLSD